MAFKGCDKGVYRRFHIDGGIFNLQQMSAKTKVKELLVRELLFADDCALFSHTRSDMELLIDRFSDAACKLGLVINLKKTELMVQARPGNSIEQSIITVEDTPLKNVNKFCYLRSSMTKNLAMDEEISCCITQAGSAFGKLTKRGRSMVYVYKPKSMYIMLLLYQLYYRGLKRGRCIASISRAYSFHMMCLRKIAGIKWQDFVSNTEVLNTCNIDAIGTFLLSAQFCLSGHQFVWKMREYQKSCCSMEK